MSKFYTNAHLLGNNIYVVGYENGRRFTDRVRYAPHMFVATDKFRGKSEFTSLKGRPVKRIDFENIFECREHIKKFRDVHGYDIFGLTNHLYVYLNEAYPGTVEYDASLITVANIDIEVAADEGFPDIGEAAKPITAICIKCRDHVYVIGCGDFENDRDDVTYIKSETEHHLLLDFLNLWEELNVDVVTGWNVENFDIPYIINRLINLFDQETALRLSPHRKIDFKYQNEQEAEQRAVSAWQERGQSRGLRRATEILGVNILDYLALYRKFTYTQQESYSLDNICSVELGEKKLDYSEYDGLMSLYKNDYQKFIEYNIKDVELVDRLDKKLGLLELAYAIAYDGKVNMQDAFTSVRMWDIIIHNYLYERKIVVPLLEVEEKERQVEGAYVKDPQTGMHKWVVSFDLNSLYPHLIMQYNIGPDTFVGMDSYKIPKEIIHPYSGIHIDRMLEGYLDENKELKEWLKTNNLAMAGSGALYTKDFRGFLPKLMEKMYNDRVVYKKQMLEVRQKQEDTGEDLSAEIAKLDNMQMAKKIQLNSAYGALGNQYFRWFDIRYAESITLSGQLSIRWAEKHVNDWMNKTLGTEGEDYVIACDTDSMYITLDRLVDKTFEGKTPTTDNIIDWMDRAAEKIIEPYIDKVYNKLATYMNAYEQKMFMKREALADKGIWTAKKRYALHVFDLEGTRFKEPYMKIMGLETQRSSVPLICRDNMKKAIRIIMEQDQNSLLDFVESFRKQFFSSAFEDIAFPRGVKGLTKYKGHGPTIYAKGTPIHVRGALVYNDMLDRYGLVNTYNPVYEGDKIKFCYLKLPNPTRENVISISQALPKQFGVDEYIDYQKQFEKSFLEPMKTITESIGWKVEQGQATLEDFF